MNTGGKKGKTATARTTRTTKSGGMKEGAVSKAANEQPDDRLGGIVMREFLASIEKAVECYANVHRGAGPDSKISTRLYEEARKRILHCFDLNEFDYTVIFGSPAILGAHIEHIREYSRDYFHTQPADGDAFVILSRELGLHIGVGALIARKIILPSDAPRYTGGGTVKLVSSDTSLASVLWAGIPEKFEPGTPHIIGAIALAKALCLLKSNSRNRELFSARHFSPEKIAAAAAALWGAGHPCDLEDILDRDELAGLSGEKLLAGMPSFFVGKDALIPTDGGTGTKIKFDNGSSTPTLVPVWKAFARTLLLPEPQHAGVIERAKGKCLEFFNASPKTYDVIFSQNTTEGFNNIARILTAGRKPEDIAVINTVIEHNSNELPWRIPGLTLITLDIDDDGFIDLNELEHILRGLGTGKQLIVTVSGASNVLGSVNDLDKICAVAHQHAASVIVDGAQLAAHRKVDMDKLGLDCLVFAGHKMYAPFGAGGVVLRKNLLPSKGNPEVNAMRRSGETNIAGLASLYKIFDLLIRADMDRVAVEEKQLTFYALEQMRAIEGISIYGLTDPSSPQADYRNGVITFDLDGMPSNIVGKRLAEKAGIETRTGWFCAHRLRKKLSDISQQDEHVLKHDLMHNPAKAAPVMAGSVRVSFGLHNNAAEVTTLVNTLTEIIRNETSAAGNTPPATPSATELKMGEFIEGMITAVYGNTGLE